MRRRNLVTSDSDEDDGEGTGSACASVASGGGGGSGSGGGRPSPANPSLLPIPFPSLSLSPSNAPVVISDDDEVEEILDSDGDSPFVDAPEDIFPPPPSSAAGTSTPVPAPAPAPTRTPTPIPPPAGGLSPAPPSAPTPTHTPSPAAHPRSTPPPLPSALSARLRPVDEFLRRLGLRLRPEWLESCAAGLSGFDALAGAAEAQARRCFEQFLFNDMNNCGAGMLPEGVAGMHNAILEGPFVLQVDEIVNTSAPLRERYRAAPAGPKRCLKLSMTDGIQRVFGMEYRPIKDLEVLAPAGLKVIIRNVHIKRGLLMLVPEAIEILGGVVDELEAARNRLVSEVNKPPRGRRKQGGLPLSSRATLAAWPCSTNVTSAGEQGISLPATVNSSYPTGLGNSSQVGRTTETLAAELDRHPVMANNVQEQSQYVQEINMQNQSTSRNNAGTSASIPHAGTSASITHGHVREEYVDPFIMANKSHEQVQRVQEVTMQDQGTAFLRTEIRSSTSTHCEYGSNHGSHGTSGTGAKDVEAAQTPDLDDEINHLGHSIILSGENEKPFTYLMSMLADWATRQDTQPYLRGKIKGVITSVKSFQYRRRTEYELCVYIDDGSYISMALVDHNVVKNIVGFSPEEVTAALSGESTLATPNEMKGTLKKLERFLVKFEGMMFIEFNKGSSVPVIRELNEGCSVSDAWLLLERVKRFYSGRGMQSLDHMDTTP